MLQARELPGELRDALLGEAPQGVRAGAMDQYCRRFVTSRPDAGCLNVASAGQSTVVSSALCGPNQFQVCLPSLLLWTIEKSVLSVPALLWKVCFYQLCHRIDLMFKNAMQVGGLLKDWAVADFLPSLVVPPTLVLRGENEELSRESVDSLVQMLPANVTLKTFQGAGSYAHIDAWEIFLESLDSFLSSHD